MSEKLENIIEELKVLTLLEASELVSKIEETFGVDSSSMGGMMMMPPGVGGSGDENNEITKEKTEFELVLEDVPTDKKIAILKVVRTITGLGLKEAKELVESTPKTVKENITKDEADVLQKQLEEVGAKITLK